MPSKTRSASAKPFSTLPSSAMISAARFRDGSLMPEASGWSWMTGAPGAIDCSGSRIAGRTSYSTRIASHARCASSGSSAATTATRSPTNRTLESSITAS